MTEKADETRHDEVDAGWIRSEEITIISPNGFHARPAARLATAAKKFRSDIKLARDQSSCNAKSVVAVMGMALEQGQKIRLMAQGPDAEEAIASLAPLISGDMEEETSAPEPAKREPAVFPRPPQRGFEQAEKTPIGQGANLFHGIAASPGIVVGVVHHVVRKDIEVCEEGESPQQERGNLNRALGVAKQQLVELEEKMREQADAGKAAIFAAHGELLDDPDLLDETVKLISSGKSAAFAWRTAFKAQASRLAGLSNELLAARAVDLEDVGRRVLMLITGVSEEKAEYPADSVLLAEDLAPSDTATLDRGRVVGFCTVRGGATSHVAILARSLGIPAVVGIDHGVLDFPSGTQVVIDGTEGTLRRNPDADEVARIRKLQDEQAARRASYLAATFQAAVTKDGRHVEVAANISGLSDARQAASLGCDGVGLLRSEFLFLDREDAPSETEQAFVYEEIAKVIGKGLPLVVRTLDVGGDKPLPYIAQAPEENPFLGVRGIRLCLDRVDLFAGQLRAILRAAAHTKLHIMFPMVSTLGELRRAKAILSEQQKAMGVTDVKVGIMVEVPSAAILARHFAKEVDFLSIGTNDLTQYTLAADRGNAKLAGIADGLDPSVLALIGETVQGANGNGCWVGVCGGIASDPLAVPVLIGLGVNELSVSVPAIPTIKARVRELSFAECQRLAENVLNMSSADEVRAHLRKILKTD